MKPLRKQTPEKRGEAGLVEFVICDGDHRVAERVRRFRGGVDAGKFQAQQCRADAGAFVAIDEGLRLRDVKGVRCGDAENVGAPLVVIVFRLTDRAFESGTITDSVAPAVFAQRTRMKFQHHLDGKKNDVRHRQRAYCARRPSKSRCLEKTASIAAGRSASVGCTSRMREDFSSLNAASAREISFRSSGLKR